jgi:hypothetical protein
MAATVLLTVGRTRPEIKTAPPACQIGASSAPMANMWQHSAAGVPDLLFQSGTILFEVLEV